MREYYEAIADDSNQLKVDDASKIIGCWKALAKQDTQDDLVGDQDPMRRAVAFCQVIEVQKNAKTHKVSSKNIAGMFQAVVEAYQEQEEFETVKKLVCEAAHVDGSMNASQKEEKLAWLKADTPDNTCRILSNVRCLSEGVDVPALDAVIFLTPRNSQVDVVQSVGRVMRNAPGKKRGYQPFEGICLTDTFQLYEKEDLVDQILVKNSARRKRQKKLDIRVIIGNPPYSVGQISQNDNNQNAKYNSLDESIYKKYTLTSSSLLGKRSSHDSYIRAIRWASDRIGEHGIIGFVTNAGYIESNSSDGVRRSLVKEFSSLYIFHLRGNSRAASEVAKKEGGNIFDIRTPVAIAILVKNPEAEKNGEIYFYDIGNYLGKKEKLQKISDLKNIQGISTTNSWVKITPDEYGDWINKRDNSFQNFISIYDQNGEALFEKCSLGVITNRDAWNYCSSLEKLKSRTKEGLSFFNNEIARYKDACNGLQPNEFPDIMDFVKKDLSITSWGGRSWKSPFKKNKFQSYDENEFSINLYRPYTKQYHYSSPVFNHSFYSIRDFFLQSNLVICLSGNKGVIISKYTPDLHLIGDSNCFPLYIYEAEETSDMPSQDDLFITKNSDVTMVQTSNYSVKSGITDAGLKHFTDFYKDKSISKEDLFYYIYGLLHSEIYREKYADNLTKELPRIPCVKTATDFWAFSKAGRKLADLHIDYESVSTYPVEYIGGALLLDTLDNADFRVTQMKFGKKKEGGKNVDDKTTVIYNHKITMTGIPLEAYDYVVNGKPALEWVMERQAVTTHKESGIVNDANLWATETMDNARYPLELFQRVITVSLETMKIVKALPRLDIQSAANVTSEADDLEPLAVSM